MIDDSIAAYNILGIKEDNNEIYLLLFDPHTTENWKFEDFVKGIVFLLFFWLENF